MPAGNPLGYLSPEVQMGLLGAAAPGGALAVPAFGMQSQDVVSALLGQPTAGAAAIRSQVGLQQQVADPQFARQLAAQRSQEAAQQPRQAVRFSDIDLTGMSRAGLIDLTRRAQGHPDALNAIGKELQRRQLQGIE